jgi:hypothetical protein
MQIASTPGGGVSGTSDKALYILQPLEVIRGMTYGGPQWIRKWTRHGQTSCRSVGSARVAMVSDSGGVWIYPSAIDDYRTEPIFESHPGFSMSQLEEWIDDQLWRLGVIPIPDSDHWRNDGLMSKLWDNAWMHELHGAERLDAPVVSSVTDLLRTLRQAALEEKLSYHVPHVSLQSGDVVVLEWWCQPRDLTIHVSGKEILWLYSESSQVTQMKDGILTSSDLPSLRGLWRQLLQGVSGQVYSSQEGTAS